MAEQARLGEVLALVVREALALERGEPRLVADALLDSPMSEVLDSLPFTEEIQLALLRREGPKGELLSSLIAYERGEFPSMPAPGVSLAGAYRAALEWADETGSALNS